MIKRACVKNRPAGCLSRKSRRKSRGRAIHVEKRIWEERRWLNARFSRPQEAERGREVCASLADIKIPADGSSSGRFSDVERCEEHRGETGKGQTKMIEVLSAG